ncbi:hypothetical protein ACFL54_02050 [Planctomycetota bacterium]
MGKTAQQQCDAYYRERTLRREAMLKGVSYRSLVNEYNEEARLRRVLETYTDHLQTEVLPAYFESVYEKILPRLPEMLNSVMERLVNRAAKKIAREVVQQLPRGLPMEEAEKEIEAMVKRIPITDFDAVLEYLAEENDKLLLE